MKCCNACILLKCTASTGVRIAGVGKAGASRAGPGRLLGFTPKMLYKWFFIKEFKFYCYVSAASTTSQLSELAFCVWRVGHCFVASGTLKVVSR